MNKRKVVIRVFEMKKECEFPWKTGVSDENIIRLLRELIDPENFGDGAEYVVEVYDRWTDSPCIFYFDGKMKLMSS
ncbi:hypothetical protein [Methanothermobacter thermautotrophicus]|uniref:hypothetical protein n=1 Tax=Methanothermobacter thermautotrophicus TaxID=145262 RepID=UPI001D032B50|nr:hypothetical protein [Methanothermobacter thermautotrophicus]